MFCSTSAIRRLSSIHFLRYASSTDGGRDGGIVPAATVRRERLLAVFFAVFVASSEGALDAIMLDVKELKVENDICSVAH